MQTETVKRPGAAKRWLAPAGVLALAAALRFWSLGTPDTLVFDELYYVRDAISQLAHGFPTDWPDDNPDFDPSAHTDEPAYVAHPPLGKWLIALGVMVFGPETGWGWRASTALAGVLTVALTMRLGWRLTGSLWVACVAGLVLAVDGVHVTLSRVSLLDAHLTLVVLLGVLLILRDHDATARQLVTRVRERSEPRGPGRDRGTWSARIGPIRVWRPWLFAATGVFGLAAGIKWSGLYALAGFLLLVVAQDLIARRRLRARMPWLGTLLQSLVLAVPLALMTIAAYLSTWAGWILTQGGWGRDSGPWPITLVNLHMDLLAWHASLTAPHPFASHPLSWPFGIRPTGMFFADNGDGWVSAITPLPNALVTLGGVAALVWCLACLGWAMVRRPRAVAQSRLLLGLSVIVVGYLSGWLPWVLTPSRSAVFQFYAVILTPFAALALAVALAWLADRLRMPLPRLQPRAREGRRLAVWVFLGSAVILGLFFWPMWSGQPQPEWFWRVHLWLPSWR